MQANGQTAELRRITGAAPGEDGGACGAPPRRLGAASCGDQPGPYGTAPELVTAINFGVCRSGVAGASPSMFGFIYKNTLTFPLMLLQFLFAVLLAYIAS